MTNKNTRKIKITFPDVAPEKQLEMAKGWIEIIDNLEKATGTVGETDKKQLLELIKKLKDKLNSKNGKR